MVMEKYAVLPDEGMEVEIVSGPLKGQQGVVKEASEGRLKIALNDKNLTVVVDDNQVVPA